MKKIILIIALLLSSQFANAQSEDTIKMVKQGELTEVTIYYNNGNIMQHGYLTSDNKLQDVWESYYEDGKKKCDATYNKGEKVGIWFYYYNDRTTKVTYDKNKIVNVEELEPAN